MKKRGIILLTAVFMLLMGTLTYAARPDYCWPMDVSIPISNKFGENHIGVDFKTNGVLGKPVYAIADGVVVLAKDIGCTGSHYGGVPACITPGCNTCSYNNYIIIKHEINHNVIYSLYAHLLTDSFPELKNGDKVRQGQQIAESGNAGKSTGPHLHFEIRKGSNQHGSNVDPEKYLTQVNVNVDAASIMGSDMTLYVNHDSSNSVTKAASVTGFACISEGDYGNSHIRWKTASGTGSVIKVVGNEDGSCAVAAVGAGTDKVIAYVVDDDGAAIVGSEDSREITVLEPTISFGASSYTLLGNNPLKLDVTVEGPDDKVTWKSSNGNIAVSQDGKLTMISDSVRKQEAKISATANGVTATCTVQYIYVLWNGSVSISKSSCTMYKGQTDSLSITPAANYTSVSWKSSNSKVVSVKNGSLTAKAVGKATITATVKLKTGQTQNYTCKVTVKKPTIVITPSSTAIYVGDTLKLKGVAYGKSKAIKWSSTNSKVVSVKKDGTIKAHKIGTAKIKATANGVTKTCKISVKNNAMKLYNAFLKKGSTLVKTSYGSSYTLEMNSFCVLDINRDGTPELIVKYEKPEQAGAYVEHYVFTVKSNKVKYAGSYTVRAEGSIRYSKKHRAVANWSWSNGAGGYGEHLFILKSGKITQYKYAWTGGASRFSSQSVYYTGNSDTKTKQTTKSKFITFEKTYFNKKNFKTYPFYANTSYNRNKKLK